MSKLNNKTAIVTGASSGIGRGIALKLANQGATVSIADIRKEPREGGKPTHELIKDNGGQAQYVNTDVSNIQDIQDAIDKTVDKFGSLEIMVNNAGIYPGLISIDDVDEADYDRLMEINLKGTFFGSKLAAEKMNELDIDGSIVNISSIAGLYGFNQSSTYCTSKGGISNLTRELALELGPQGIRVNAVNPGVIETSMTTEDEEIAGSMQEEIPLGRDGKPEDVANAVSFLASDEAAYVNGHNLVVDGGYTAK